MKTLPFCLGKLFWNKSFFREQDNFLFSFKRQLFGQIMIMNYVFELVHMYQVFRIYICWQL